MKIVFDADNGLEAHMILDLLAMQGIEAWIQGEHLTGGVGELPPVGLVKVSVDERDYLRARDIIARWEAQGPARVPPRLSPQQSAGAGGYVLTFLLGLALGGGAVYWQCRSTSAAAGDPRATGSRGTASDERVNHRPGIRPPAAP